MERVAVVGTGLIGGSVALGLKARGGFSITGFDPDAEALARALERGAIDLPAADAGEAARDADLVVVAVPVDRMQEACAEIASAVGSETVVTDVGSAKAEPVQIGEEAFGPRFVGGHPMAGSEQRGIGAADPGLFQDAWWILTPTAQTADRSLRVAAGLASSLGARPIALDPLSHDALVARLSHLPQITASALVDLATSAGDRDALLGVAGGGFRDVTRIAGSHPELWVAILQANRAAVQEALSLFRARLGDLEAMLEEQRWDELTSFLTRARHARLELFAKPVERGEPVELHLLVPDRAGVLAEVTTAAGTLGINIEDLRIIHSTEGGRGRLELLVAAEQASGLQEALESLGYHVERAIVDL